MVRLEVVEAEGGEDIKEEMFGTVGNEVLEAIGLLVVTDEGEKFPVMLTCLALPGSILNSKLELLQSDPNPQTHFHIQAPATWGADIAHGIMKSKVDCWPRICQFLTSAFVASLSIPPFFPEISVQILGQAPSLKVLSVHPAR